LSVCYFPETQKRVAFLSSDGGNVTHALHEEEQSEKRRISEEEDRGRERERVREGTYHSNCPKVFHCICTERKWAQISLKKCLTCDVSVCV